MDAEQAIIYSVLTHKKDPDKDASLTFPLENIDPMRLPHYVKGKNKPEYCMADPPNPPQARRRMDIAFAHFLKLFPLLFLRKSLPQHQFKVIQQLPTEYKAVETYTDSAWKMEMDGKPLLVLYEEMTKWDNQILADLHFRKAAFHKEYGLPPLGVILLPEDVKKNQKPLTDYLCGMEELPHTKDQNLLISLPDLPKEKSPNDPAEVLVSLFHKNLSLSEAIEAVENISKVVPDPKLVSEVQTLAFFFASRRFGKDQLRELWKRMKPMIATNEFYQEIIEEGEVKGEAKGILKGWAKAINSALEDRFDVIPAPKIRDKILLESNPDTLREWFRASQKASSFEDFRQRTGL